jgi:uncharacterized BrkB/YihY/UPF0761 family membrane protein
MRGPERARRTRSTGGAVVRGRAKQIQDWLRTQGDTALGRLALQWFRRYFESSRNSACAITVYSSLSVLPAALVAVAYFHPTGADANVFAGHLVDHLKLTGPTAQLVEETFGSASANALAATVAVAVSALLWGIGIGQLYQDVYARAWGVKVGSIADQGLFALFFFIFAGTVALQIVCASRFEGAAWFVLVPGWLLASTAFWLLVPTLLLHRTVPLRALLPGALVASVVIGGTIAASPLFVAAPLTQNGQAFGSLGVVLTTIGFLFVLVTISLVCAVFSPVWISWRAAERDRRKGAVAPADSLVAPR